MNAEPVGTVKHSEQASSAHSNFQLTPQTEAHICSDDPWLVLHKLDSPTKMRYIGARFAECGDQAAAAASFVVPGSIAKHVAKIGRSGGGGGALGGAGGGGTEGV